MSDILSTTKASRSLGGGTTIIPENLPVVAIVGFGGGRKSSHSEVIVNGGLLDSLAKDHVKLVTRIGLKSTGPSDYIRNVDFRLVEDSIDWSIAPVLPAPSVSSVSVSAKNISVNWSAGTYYFAVSAIDVDGRETMVGASTNIVDPTAAKLITVSWSAVPGAVKYKVYRKNGTDFTVPGQAYLIALVDAGTLSVKDNNTATAADLSSVPSVTNSSLGTVLIASVEVDATTPATTSFKVGTYIIS